FPSRIGRLMMGFGTHAQYLLKYIYQSAFTGAPQHFTEAFNVAALVDILWCFSAVHK
ncbi:hypothetical protein ABIC84_003026, partial [Mucilaginibacter sp. 3215]